jgi:hypothetical protein
VKPDPFTRDDYRDILRCGLAAGYRFASFNELRQEAPSSKRCFMRHDCDNDLVAAAAMAEIEAEEGVLATHFLMLRSAMYNLLAPENLRLARQIVACGQAIGLHYDASVPASEPGNIAADVDRQRNFLSAELGVPVEVVSFHQPDELILSGRVRINCINTYDATDMSGAYYTSDSNLSFRGGDPRDLFSHGDHDSIQILTHPEWWTAIAMPLMDKWATMLMNNIDLMQKSLLEREKTYNDKHAVTIRPSAIAENVRKT